MRVGFTVLQVVIATLVLVHSSSEDKLGRVAEAVGPDHAHEHPVDRVRRAFNTPGLNEWVIQEMINYHNAWEKTMMEPNGRTDMQKLTFVYHLEQNEEWLQNYRIAPDSKRGPVDLKLVSY